MTPIWQPLEPRYREELPRRCEAVPFCAPQERADLRVEDSAHDSQDILNDDPAVRIQHSRKDRNMLIFFTCAFAGAWVHSLYVINRQSHEIARLRLKLWSKGLED